LKEKRKTNWPTSYISKTWK